MGSSASSQSPARSGVVSPRVEIAKDGQQDVVLDSNPLSDVGHGTIHYRYEKPEHSVHDLPGCNKENIPTGYFFHPKLQDYSDAEYAQNEEARKFVRVVEGPASDQNKHVFYISGIGFDGANNQIPKTLLASQGKQNSKKIFGHKYFVLKFNDQKDIVQAVKMDEPPGKLTTISDSEVEMTVPELSTIKDVKRKLSQHFIIPVGIIHIISLDKEIEDASLLREVLVEDLSDCSSICIRLVLQ